MTRASLREHAAVQRQRYLAATRAEKGILLDEVIAVTGHVDPHRLHPFVAELLDRLIRDGELALPADVDKLVRHTSVATLAACLRRHARRVRPTTRARSVSAPSALGDIGRAVAPALVSSGPRTRPFARAHSCAQIFGARCVQRSGGAPEHYSFTGMRTGAPLAFSSTTTNRAGSVLLVLRPTM